MRKPFTQLNLTLFLLLAHRCGSTAERGSHVRFGSKADRQPVTAMSALPPKADITSVLLDVRFVPKADIQPPGLGARYRQYWHHLHGFSRKNREVRMLLEQLGGGVMRFRPN